VTSDSTQAGSAQDALATIRDRLREFLETSDARMALLLDEGGVVVLEAGQVSDLDTAAFGSLTVSHLGALRALASLIGEAEFRALCHQGEHSCIFVARVAGAILCILFDGRKPVDQVSKEGRSIASSLEGPIRQFLETGVGVGADLGSTWGNAADEEIDRVFGEGA
jgi:hypothetical protein